MVVKILIAIGVILAILFLAFVVAMYISWRIILRKNLKGGE